MIKKISISAIPLTLVPTSSNWWCACPKPGFLKKKCQTLKVKREKFNLLTDQTGFRNLSGQNKYECKPDLKISALMDPGKYYHIYTHANGSENLFREEENYRYFLQRYRNFIPPVAHTLAYCLMPNHLHLLVQIKNENSLAEVLKAKENKKTTDLTGFKNLSGLTILQFSHLFNAYSKAYNKKYKRMGSLFIRSFNRKEIQTDEQLTTVIRYIHHNPVNHGFTKHPGEWPWSSYTNVLSQSSPAWFSKNWLTEWFGNITAFQKAHEIPLQESEIPTS